MTLVEQHEVKKGLAELMEKHRQSNQRYAARVLLSWYGPQIMYQAFKNGVSEKRLNMLAWHGRRLESKGELPELPVGGLRA